MDTFILVLKIMLYLAAIVLLVVLTVLGIKAIKVMGKTDKILDEVDEKVKTVTIEDKVYKVLMLPIKEQDEEIEEVFF